MRLDEADPEEERPIFELFQQLDGSGGGAVVRLVLAFALDGLPAIDALGYCGLLLGSARARLGPPERRPADLPGTVVVEATVEDFAGLARDIAVLPEVLRQRHYRRASFRGTRSRSP
jgi:hypothetical protein